MKRILFVFAVLAFVVSSCGESKKEEVKKEEKIVEKADKKE